MFPSNRVDWRNLMKWLVIAGAPLIYFLLSMPYTGPAYLADEIGYLAKAAFLAGHTVDGASSYHGGYSVLLAPLFALLSDPASIWKAVMFLNALMWGGCFYILNLLIDRFGNHPPAGKKIFVLLLTALYPSWSVMTGYAFPHPFFSLVYLASILLLLNWKTSSVKSLLPYSFCVGFLYWIHPTGLGPVISSVVIVGILAVHFRILQAFFLHTGVVLILALLYQKGFHEWMAAGMTMPGFSGVNTYSGAFPSLTQLSNLDFWIEWAAKAAGQFSYLIVGSFGLIVFGVNAIWSRLHASIKSMPPGKDIVLASAGAYGLLSMLAILLIGSLMFTTTATSSVNHWIYGRYVDATAMPIIGLGAYLFINLDKQKRLFLASISTVFLLVSGIVLASLVGKGAINNLMNTPSFYPQYFITIPDFAMWMSIGAIGTIAAAIFGKYFTAALMVLAFGISTSNQGEWHEKVLSNHSVPSSVIELIRKNYSPGTCIGFDASLNAKTGATIRLERFGLYRYHLFNYEYKRMSFAEWVESCDGPFITYNPAPYFDDPRFEVVARENIFDLFVVVKRGVKKLVLPETVLGIGGIVLAENAGKECMRSGCFSVSAKELTPYSKVAVFDDGKLISTNKSGFAFFGPYLPLKKGEYNLIIHGDFHNIEEATLDVISHKPRTEHYKSIICPFGCPKEKPVSVPFSLGNDVTSLEVRLSVGANDKFLLSGYEIRARQEESILQKPVLQVYGKMLADLPTQVGKMSGRELITTGKAGYLAYGPYVTIPKGLYEITLFGSSSDAKNAFVEVFSQKRNFMYKKIPLETTNNEIKTLAKGIVNLSQESDIIEVRIGVGREDTIKVRGYKLVPINDPAAIEKRPR